MSLFVHALDLGDRRAINGKSNSADRKRIALVGKGTSEREKSADLSSTKYQVPSNAEKSNVFVGS